MSTDDKQKIESTIAKLRENIKTEPIARFLETKLMELTPGYARFTMKMKAEYLNFNGVIFGGIIGAIIDQAFGYASNSLAPPSLATQYNIHFISAVKVADELTAECRVVKNGRRVGISEVTVTNQAGKLIAKATGTTIPVKDS